MYIYIFNTIIIQFKNLYFYFFILETKPQERKRLELEKAQQQRNQQGATSSSGGDVGADHELGKNQSSTGDK